MRIVRSSNRQNSKFKTAITSVRKYSFWYIYLWKMMPGCKIEKKKRLTGKNHIIIAQFE